MVFRHLRSPIGLGAVAALTIAATGAGAATIHRFAVSQTTGSGGATTFLQSSASSSALQGEVASTARTSITIPFGVLGEYDAPGTTFGIGVAGITTTGYAVAGEALGAQPTVLALAGGTGDGEQAYANNLNSNALYAENQAGTAIAAVGDAGDGVDAFTTTPNAQGVYGQEDEASNASNPAYGVFGYSESGNGFGMYGQAAGAGVGTVGESDAGAGGSPSLAGFSGTTGGDLIDGVVSGSDNNVYQTFGVLYGSANASGSVITTGGAESDVESNGDLYLTGQVYTGCTAIFPAAAANCTAATGTAAVARNNRGQAVTTYAGHEASPTMEDSGEAQLVNGYARVTLDPAYAATISSAQPYLVFLTPMGESRGLYVTNRTPSGFEVRENATGRSSMTFDYRIVAHPYADRSQRLAIVNRGAFSRGPMRSSVFAKLAAHHTAALRNERARFATVKRTHPQSLFTLTRTLH